MIINIRIKLSKIKKTEDDKNKVIKNFSYQGGLINKNHRQ